MQRVCGDRAARASSTNACGTALRGLTARRGSCGEGVLRRGVVMRLRIAGFPNGLKRASGARLHKAEPYATHGEEGKSSGSEGVVRRDTWMLSEVHGPQCRLSVWELRRRCGGPPAW